MFRSFQKACTLVRSTRHLSTMSGPRIQQAAPAFTVDALMPNKEFKTISLSDYAGKWVVLFFYPLDFTFVCPTEIISFSDRSGEFEAINTQVIAASCDSLFSVSMMRSCSCPIHYMKYSTWRGSTPLARAEDLVT